MTKAARMRISDLVQMSVATSVSRLDANEPALWTEHDPEHGRATEPLPDCVRPLWRRLRRAVGELGVALAHVQDLLGEHQDVVVADAWLAKTAPECTPDEAFALGMLAEIERGSAVRARAAFPRAWNAASRRRLRAWL